ncbi:ferredoxin [Trujillonella endophytica]|uniref:Ferredoxin n=1 Tax=Trujillonella endophytica TaxID=673521 RepID=A0A1H8SF83_9ACTN|nr:ferredoxin [Trujillella endophytica]SEO77331.1 ferredoxin [Trujillella endophytica]
MRIEADRGRCIGAGMCALNAPELFDQDDDGLVVVLEPEPGPEQEAAARNAVDTCPAAVLSVSG